MNLRDWEVFVRILPSVTLPSSELVFGKLQNGWPRHEIVRVQGVLLQSSCRQIWTEAISVKVAVSLIVTKRLMITLFWSKLWGQLVIGPEEINRIWMLRYKFLWFLYVTIIGFSRTVCVSLSLLWELLTVKTIEYFFFYFIMVMVWVVLN